MNTYSRICLPQSIEKLPFVTLLINDEGSGLLLALKAGVQGLQLSSLNDTRVANFATI